MFRKRNINVFKKKTLITTSYDTIIYNDNGEKITLESFLGDYEFEDDLINKLILLKSFSRLTTKSKEITVLMSGDKTQQEIADILGVTQPYLSKTFKKSIEKMRKEFMEEC